MLVSIQSQVLNDLPHRNEPGLEHASLASCEEYNRNIRFYTAMIAIVDAIPSTDAALTAPGRLFVPEFADVVHAHLSIKRAAILHTLRAWAERDKPMPASHRAKVPGLVQDWTELFEWWDWPRLIADFQTRLPLPPSPAASSS